MTIITEGFFNDPLKLAYRTYIEPNKENPAAIDANTRAILKKLADQSLEVPLSFQMISAVGVVMQLANDKDCGSTLLPKTVEMIGFLITGLADFGEACSEIEHQAEAVLKASRGASKPVPIPVTQSNQ